MTIDKCHNYIDFVAEKERAGFFNPERKDMALDMASMQRFSSLLPVYGINEPINESLTPFKRNLDITNVDSSLGLITLPDDYEYLTQITKVGFDNVRQTPTYYGVEVLNDDEISDRLNSQMMPVTLQKPFAQRLANANGKQQLQLYPRQANSLTISYLKRPNVPKYEYSIGGPDGIDITFVPTGSVDLNWKERDIFQIIFRALTILGVNLNDDKLVAYGQMLNQQTP